MSSINVHPTVEYEDGDVQPGAVPGFVYLMHFAEPVSHAQHYLGFTTDLNSRFKYHAKGKGARLVKVALERGIEITIVRIWKADGNFERKLKKRKEGPRLCPVCKGECNV